MMIQPCMAAHAAQLGAVGQLSAAARAQRGITLDAPTLAVLQQHAATLTHEATRLQFHVMSTRAGLHALDAQTYAGRQVQVQRVVAAARTQGLTVTEVTANRMVAPADAEGNVTASGGVARSQPAADAPAALASRRRRSASCRAASAA